MDFKKPHKALPQNHKMDLDPHIYPPCLFSLNRISFVRRFDFLENNSFFVRCCELFLLLVITIPGLSILVMQCHAAENLSTL